MPINMPVTSKIGIESSKTVKFNITTINFSSSPIWQGIPAGINCIRDYWDLTWNYLTLAEAELVESNLKASRGTEYFIWTPCKETKAKHYRLDGGFNKSFNQNKTTKISAKFYQIFDFIFDYEIPILPENNPILYKNKLDLSSVSKDAGIKKITGQFGNGYKQELILGLDTITDEWKISWSPLTGVEVLLLEQSLIYTLYSKPLIWTPEGESVEKEFFVEEYNRNYLTGPNNVGGYFQISATLKENFQV